MKTFFWMVVMAMAIPALCRTAEKSNASLEVRFRTERAGLVSINLYHADGTLVRRLVESKKLAAGIHKISWDGRAENGAPAVAGDYTWRGLFHEGIGLKLRGWVANGSAPPWPATDGRGKWGGDAGVPSAVAADASQVYLGWSLAEQGNSIVACDLEGRVQWAHRRAEGASGCKALAVDDGLLYVLGGLAGRAAEGGSVYRLRVRDGQPVPWPNGQLDLKIASFWPASATTKPDRADAMAVRHNRIFLTFTDSEFLAVLEAKTGAYLQTVVGAPPGQIDVAPTKTDLPDAPGKLVDADFAVISLRGGVLGKVLFAHDPLWVVTSEFSPVERDVRINALTVIGDGAKFHRHTVFVGLDGPFHQVQARPLLDMEGYTWVAGRPGGRPLLGPWQPDTLRAIRSVALDAGGQLWVAEGDAFPKRFSVWETSGQQGKLVREFFGPAETGASGGAINPLDPELMFAQGCEWRIDRQTGQAVCLGVVTREAIQDARYGVGENGRAYLVTGRRGGEAVDIFERLGDGDYRLRARFFAEDRDGKEVAAHSPAPVSQTAFWADEDGDGAMQASEVRRIPAIRFRTERTAQDLTLETLSTEGAEKSSRMAVQSWSPCGAPRYDYSQSKRLSESGGILSADGRLLFTQSETAIDCREVESGRERWRFPAQTPGGISLGVARLPAPLGNVWMVTGQDGRARFLNEDGFELARFGSVSPEAAVWPKVAAPGAEMTQADLGRGNSLIHAVDDRLFLQAGGSAFWNLEVSGLGKVEVLPGGKISIPAAK